MKEPTREQQLQMIRQYKAAAPALAAHYASELQALTDEETLRRSQAVLSVPVTAEQRRRDTSGLIEQQAIFKRWWEKHPA